MSDAAAKKRGLPQRVKMRHDTHFVEDLVGRHPEDAVGRMLGMRSISPDPNQPRSSMGELDELVESIRSKGVLEPILVRPVDEADDTESGYRIVSGERRYRAARRAGLDEIPAIIMEIDEDEALEVALVENLQRKDLTPFEEAEGYRALGEIHGYTQEQIAAAVGKGRSGVTESLQLLQLGQPVRQAVEALGVHSKSVLLGILKAGRSEQEQIEMLEHVAEGSLSREDLREQVRRQSRARKGGRQKPPVFTFKDPEKTFSLSVKFRKTTVEKDDLIAALEKILDELRTERA
ncbi:MAG: ParB/RepB/Spo0J family partition protein [Acidobacteriota bacterium]|nr:ParB/RepB/Spo0J family partition protein [Acidobacteriota bacterium]